MAIIEQKKLQSSTYTNHEEQPNYFQQIKG